MNRMTQTCLLLAAALTVTGLVGCDGNAKQNAVFAFSDDGQYLQRSQGPGVVPNDNSPIPDVPMPIGFKPVVSKSGSTFDGYTRDVQHVYQGRAEGPDVVLFYKQQLWHNDWQLDSREFDADGAVLMYYSKGREALRVRVHERSGLSTVVITISPRMAATTPADPA